MKEEAKKLTDENLETVTGGEKTVSDLPWERCPKCGSIRRFAHPVPDEGKIDFECIDCGHRWEFRY